MWIEKGGKRRIDVHMLKTADYIISKLFKKIYQVGFCVCGERGLKIVFKLASLIHLSILPEIFIRHNV